MVIYRLLELRPFFMTFVNDPVFVEVGKGPAKQALSKEVTTLLVEQGDTQREICQ